MGSCEWRAHGNVRTVVGWPRARKDGLETGKSRFAKWACALSCALSLACGGGPQFDGRVYRDKNVAFRVGPLPAGFRQVSASESLLAFRNDEKASTLAINARCHLDGDDVPLRALVQHLFLQFTDRQELGQRQFSLDGRDALEVEMIAALDGVRRHFVVTVFKKDDCVYDFLLIEDGDNATVARVNEDYRGLVAGFATLDQAEKPEP